MYLFTIVFIFLTIIGVFTEVLSLQNNRFFTRQITGASILATWHNAAVNAAHYSLGGVNVFPNWGAGTTACTLGATGAPAASLQAPFCPDAGGALAPALLENLVVAPATPIATLLPPQFTARFQTVIFTATNGTNARMVVTFVNPTANASDPLPPTGYTASQIFRQLGRLNIDKSTYGFVVGNQLQPTASPGAGMGNYSIRNDVSLVTPDLMFPNGPIVNGALVLFTPL